MKKLIISLLLLSLLSASVCSCTGGEEEAQTDATPTDTVIETVSDSESDTKNDKENESSVESSTQGSDDNNKYETDGKWSPWL